MRKILLLVMALLCICLPVCAQVQVTFAWDQSSSDTRDPGAVNPVKYYLYLCADQTLTNCNKFDTATNLEYQSSLVAGKTWAYVTAYQSAVIVDGKPVGGIVESSKSNVLGLQVTVPPGNPTNTKIKLIGP